MWHKNGLTERLNLQWPILQAPMGAYSSPALAAAVSNAGALGGLGMSGLSVESVRRRIEGFRQQSDDSLNVNHLLWKTPDDLSGIGEPMRTQLQTLYDKHGLGTVPDATPSHSIIEGDHLDILLELKPEVVSFHFGLPERNSMKALKDAGIYIIGCATTVKEARSLEIAEVDAIIAQGTEAGGHRGTFSDVETTNQSGLFSLLPQVSEVVNVPVIAAGGVANGQGIAAALMLGASAVQLGTAFLCCAEANVSDAHRLALSTATDNGTVITDVVTGKPARFIRNNLINTLTGEEPLPFPSQQRLTAQLEKSGNPEYMGLYAGQSAALTTEMPASDLVQRLAAEAERCFAKFI